MTFDKPHLIQFIVTDKWVEINCLQIRTVATIRYGPWQTKNFLGPRLTTINSCNYWLYLFWSLFPVFCPILIIFHINFQYCSHNFYQFAYWSRTSTIIRNWASLSFKIVQFSPTLKFVLLNMCSWKWIYRNLEFRKWKSNKG